MSNDFHLSVVVPLKDEDLNVEPLGAKLARVLESLTPRWEVILVDDGSTRPTTWPWRSTASDPRFKVLRFSRNFGHQVALSAGLDAASGDAVITMDGDLQHPPEGDPSTSSPAGASGAQVVFGVMAERQGESRFKAIAGEGVSSGTLTKLAPTSTSRPAPVTSRLRRVAPSVEAYRRRCGESHRYLPGDVQLGWEFDPGPGIEYASPPRVAGRSKYSTGRMIRLATDAIVGFSDRPLRLALNLGVRRLDRLRSSFGLSALVSRCRRRSSSCPDGTSIMVLVGVVGGIQLIVIGIIGEYVSRISDEVKRRPLYIVSRSHGLEVGPLPPWR